MNENKPEILIPKGKSIENFERRSVPKLEEDWQGALRDKVNGFLEGNLKDRGGEEIYERIKEKVERDPEAGLFNSIQEELVDLEHNPHLERETALKMGRQYLLNEAKERMIFRDIRPQILKAQISNDYETSLEIIKNINTGNLEYREAAQSDWSKDFRGMLNVYKETALFHTRLAYLRASSQGNIAQAKGLERKLDLRSWGDPPLELYPIALQWVTQQEVTRGVTQVTDGEELTQALDRLTESLGEGSPEAERLKWIDMEYKMEFYEKFDPRTEPKFYKNFTNEEERRLWDDRWQLARAAYFKKLTATAPDKYTENQHLSMFGKEQMERLYDMPGVKRMMEGYTQAIVLEEVTSPDGRKHKVDFWPQGKREMKRGIKDAATFDKFRKEMRERMLVNENLDKVAQIEADAVAWSMIYVGNLAESVDSRYSYSGRSHFGMPGVLMAEEYKFVLHPQERFEVKSLLGHFYGAFGKWGVEHVGNFKDEVNFSFKNDEVLFFHTEPKKYWKYEQPKGVKPESKEAEEEGGRVFYMYTPECYPTITAKSFWEETKVGKPDEQVPLLTILLKGEDIDWDSMYQDAWPIYMFGSFNKAVQLLEYYKPGKELEEGKEVEWTRPLMELFGRLKPKREMDRLWKIYSLSRKSGLGRKDREYLEKEDPTGKLGQNALPPTQSFLNLKTWAVWASYGGIHDPTSKKATPPLTNMDRRILQTKLSNSQNRFIQGGVMGLDIGDRLLVS